MFAGLKKKTGPVTLDTLACSSLLAGLTREELACLVGSVCTRRLGKGEQVFREGESGEELFIVEEGRVAISKAVKGNLEQVLAHMGPGDFFGEIALLEKVPRTASASAEEDCVLLVINQADLFGLMDKEPRAAARIMYNLLKAFTSRLQDTNEQVREALRWGLEATGYQPE